MSLITKSIKKKGIDLGFTKIGIAKAEELKEEGVNLKKWLGNGFHADMVWLRKNYEKRINPFKIMPDAKSVLIAAGNYFQRNSDSNKHLLGKISRYAWGDDYHNVIGGKLKELLEYTKQIIPDTHGKYFVDSGAIMEKAFANRAGIGWVGKNSLIMNREYGSWLFLGVILLNVELEYDDPYQNYCGTCNKCIEACPTGALISPHILDSRLCISYITIEQKNVIDPIIGNKTREWIYGCDECQDVCPWNKKFSKITKIKEFESKLENLNLIDNNVNEMSEFDRLFHRSPIKRIKLKKFLNNFDNARKNKEE